MLSPAPPRSRGGVRTRESCVRVGISIVPVPCVIPSHCRVYRVGRGSSFLLYWDRSLRSRTLVRRRLVPSALLVDATAFERPATPAMASMLMVIHLMQRSVLRRPDTETCAVRSAHASREVLDRSLSCGRSVDAIGAPQRLRCQLPHIGASGAPAASNEACWCATATPTGQSKPTGRETPFFHTVGGAEAILF